MASVAVLTAVSKPNNRRTLLEKLLADAQRTVAPNDDQRIQFELSDALQHLIGAVFNHLFAIAHHLAGERIASIGGAQNRAPSRQDAAYALGRQDLHTLRIDQAFESVTNADHLAAEIVVRRFHHRTNDSIQAGGIAPSGENPQAFHRIPLSGQPPVCGKALVRL